MAKDVTERTMAALAPPNKKTKKQTASASAVVDVDSADEKKAEEPKKQDVTIEQLRDMLALIAHDPSNVKKGPNIANALASTAR